MKIVQLIMFVPALGTALCGCSTTIRQNVAYPYGVVRQYVLEKGGYQTDMMGRRSCQIELVEGWSKPGAPDRTLIRATEAGTNETTLEVESIENAALFHWQKSRERQRLTEFLDQLRTWESNAISETKGKEVAP